MDFYPLAPSRKQRDVHSSISSGSTCTGVLYPFHSKYFLCTKYCVQKKTVKHIYILNVF